MVSHTSHETTTVFGATVGPRVSFPLSDLDLHLPVVDLLELYSHRARGTVHRAEWPCG